MMSDASEMLAAALEQMDGIIAGNHAVPLSAGTELLGSCLHLEAFKLHAGNLTVHKASFFSRCSAKLLSILLNRNVHVE